MEGCQPRPPTRRRPALDATTLAEAFQLTASEHPDRVALRTKGDEFTITWGEYRDRVIAAGLAALGLGRGDTSHPAHEPARVPLGRLRRHDLGATPFSIYNTYTAEQIEYLVGDATNSIVVTETGVRGPRAGASRGSTT